MGVVFVHLSDIHFGQEKEGGRRFVNEDARRQLILDASAVVANLPAGRASGILLTGDIAFAGKASEYKAAGEWLDALSRQIGCAESDIQMVPGNHDIDRAKICSVTELLLTSIFESGEVALDRYLDEQAGRDVLYGKFADYRQFAEAYQCPLDCHGKNSADRRVELAPGRFIRFVRLNSALICSKRRDEKGRLLLGARQRVMTESPGEELIVLSHHPLDWHADSVDTTRFLRSRARVFISGHVHVADVSIDSVEPGRDLMMVAAGATTPDEVNEQFTYCYNVIEFDWDEDEDALAVTIHPRVWRDDMKRFESDVSLREFTPRTVLGSPNFPKAVRPPVSERGAVGNEVLQPAVEILASDDGGLPSDEVIEDAEYQNLYLRFFRDLDQVERLRILVEANAMPKKSGAAFNHETESRLFAKVARGENFAALREKIHRALETTKINEGTYVQGC